ncbi:MAG: GNAT family N-acetyltransferase, partial [Oleiphilaceae bacterium]|nr:GNAT family N-acetyltransferase [Oleiphilaceae bacterium]
AWQEAWWRQWGTTQGFELIKHGGEGSSGLYVDHYRYKHILSVKCLQFVGTNYRRISTPRTEYNTLAGASGSDPLGVLRACDWTEAVFRDVLENSELTDQLRALAYTSGWHWRVVARDRAYSIDTSSVFEQYLQELGKNTRARLFNRRKILADCGEVGFVQAWPDQFDWFFGLLNDFHVNRWGQRCFNDKSLAFHREFLTRVLNEGGKPDLSVMTIDGEAVSVLYNVSVGGITYNLQSGYIADFHPKLALGTLHLGYSIERAFECPDITLFDLLAGSGKNENYKSRLATNHEDLISFMLVRDRLFQWLYRLKP